MTVLYEDNHLIVVNKSCGELVQADSTGDVALEQSVKDYLKRRYNKPGEVFLGVVHRVDRPVSGIVVFARTTKAQQRLNLMFQKKEIKKTYWAIVKTKPRRGVSHTPPNVSPPNVSPTPDAGTLIHYITRNTKTNRSYASNEERTNSKKAILHYRLLTSSDRYHLLEIDLETGRHHQIRCQLAAVGSSVRGDLKYGYERSNPNGGISLHARQIQFAHPVKEEIITLTAPLPDDPLWKVFESMIK